MDKKLLKLQEKLGRGRSVIGLHIGTSSVNIVQVVQFKGQPTLIRSVIQEIVHRKGEGPGRAITLAVHAGLAQFPCQRASIICTFHDPQLFVKKITTPPMPLHELGDAVHLAVKNDFPFSLDEAFLDFRLIRKFAHEGKQHFSVLVAACPREVIERVQSFFLIENKKEAADHSPASSGKHRSARSSHIKISSITPGAVALENLVRRFKFKHHETVAIIALRSKATELMIYRNSHFEFFRNLSVTGDDITRSMAGDFFSDSGKTELTLSEAEEIKTLYGIPQAGDELPAQAKITSQQILTLIGPKIEQMIAEINRSFDYYRQELKGGKVDRVLLVGGGAQLKGLDNYLSNELGMDVKCGDPFEGIALLDPSLGNSKEDAQIKVFAIGAALGTVKDINFLSKISIRRNNLDVAKFLAMSAVIAVFVSSLFAFVYLEGQIRGYKDRIGSDKQRLESQLTQAREILAVQKLKGQRPLWGEILKVFSHLPQSISLDGLSYSNGELNIRGVVLDEEEGAHAILSKFILELQDNVAKDARVKLTKRVKDADGEHAFEIVASVRTVKP